MWKRFERIPLLPISAAGFLLGIILGILYKGNGELLSAENLCRIKDMTPDRGRLFYEILKARGGMALILIVAGTTYLAPAACMLTALWFGVSIGMFQAIAMTQYGIKGILLMPGAIFPQFLIYLPAYYFMLCWCEKLYRTIYLRADWKKWSAAMGLILILSAITAGIILEYTVNPGFLQSILKML